MVNESPGGSCAVGESVDAAERTPKTSNRFNFGRDMLIVWRGFGLAG